MQRNEEEKNMKGLRMGKKKLNGMLLHVVLESQEFFAVCSETSIRINLIKESNTFSAAFIFCIWLKSGN